ncbi:hypothetical protein AVEN_48284-1 [Araneus ventricosus]|uniref:Ig-like domain-containing protein n=1 Tax=Araneus ventricosus TaxID=182803 RepID=A0A4Y2TAW6_ARAVE|nr:hypothetical protein AVEN_48284-1 [Araneus ventricosus]
MDSPLSQQVYFQWLRAMILRSQQMNSGMLKPAYTCDRWFQKKRLCEEWRNVGSTVTFALATPPPEMVGRVRIEWFQRFHFLNQTAKEKNITYSINPKDPPWNMVIGSEGRELRISPITESDIMVNYFIAVAHFERGSPKRKLNFAIQAMPTDIGLVYPGDTVTIHMPSYVSLPAESMTYLWQMEGVSIFLPSNMRPSRSGASLTVFELRKEQEGILACAVFTNLGIFATQKRFVIKNVESGKFVECVTV